MAANTTGPIWGLVPKTTGVNFVNATGAGVKQTICTAGANGARVIGIGATTSDTAANDVNLFVQPGGSGTVYNIGGKRVPLASGDLVASTVAATQLLDTGQMPFLLPDGSLQLGPNDVLQAATVAAVTAAKTLSIVTQSTDY